MDDVMALVRAGRLADAEAAIARAPGAGTERAEGLFRAGNVAARARRLDEAAFLFRQALDAVPGHPAILANLGSVCLEAGQVEAAAEALRAAVTARPDMALAWSGLGGALKELGEVEEAERSCRQALALAPSLVQAHINLGVILKARGLLDEAAAAQHRALSLAPDSSAAHGNLASLALERHDYAQAMRHCRAALDLNPANHSAMANLAGALHHTQRTEEALHWFEAASQGRGGIDGKGQINYGLALRDSQRNGRGVLLERLDADHVYATPAESAAALAELARTVPVPPSQTRDALDRFCATFAPDRLYDAAWWADALDRFGDSRYAPDKVLRAVFTRVYSWSLPTREALAAIAGMADGRRLASYGAGSGYWEWLLQAHFGVPVTASDLHLGHRFIPMVPADFRTAAVDPDDVVLLSWILNHDAVVDALLPLLDRMAPGQRLILVGDSRDRNGRPRTCGTQALFTHLDRHFRLERSLPLPRFACLHDGVDLLTRRG